MEKLKGYTSSMIRLVEEFEKLPGLGRTTAARRACHVLPSPTEAMTGLAHALPAVRPCVADREQTGRRVAHLTDRGTAIERHLAHLAGGETQEGEVALF